MGKIDFLLGRLAFVTILLGLYGCDEKQAPQQVNFPFEVLDAEQTGVEFVNKVENVEDFNIFLYRNFYNGGGVAIGDINNDGLSDIYFTNNMGDNALYLNKGNFQFQDITSAAGVACKNKWSTGAALVDINSDGLLDIYVCNAGYQKGVDQRNELFINNGDLTFTEKGAAYKVDDDGYTTQAAFFDLDKDGDLDVYIVNNSFMPVNTLNYSNKRDLPASEWPVKDYLKGGGAKLLRNDGGVFTDITKPSGIYHSLIGFGLGITVGDVNNDGWEDLYISNDFFERDYLYINQHDGTFKEEVKKYMNHLSTFSMGADMADVNNDGLLDIFVTDMLPDDDFRLKTTTSFDDYQVYKLKLDRDFYHQFMQNTLQINNGNNTFSEIAHYSGVSASDWSWGALLFDFDNDGYRDIYVSNGIMNDVTNQDFIDFFANDVILNMALSGSRNEVSQIINKMPSTPLKNKLFLNKGDLTFQDISENDQNLSSFSNGAAYGDLDNDGDLDLVVNNANQKAFLLKNNTSETTKNHFLKVRVIGTKQNSYAIGAKIFVYHNNRMSVIQQVPFRGFQSSVDYTQVFGLGKSSTIDSVVVRWPDQTQSVLLKPGIDTLLVIDQNKVALKPVKTEPVNSLTTPIHEVNSPFAAHHEDDFVDFFNEGLVLKMVSREGPKAAVGDVNGDGLEDIFISNGFEMPGNLYLQNKNGFELSKQKAFEQSQYTEGTAAVFFDSDLDGDLDLFVGTGGNNSFPGSSSLQDRIYLNDGQGNFTIWAEALPNNGMNTAVAIPVDFDNDKDWDLFVGSRSVPGVYGVSPKSYLYENDGHGKYKDVTDTKAPELRSLGMITDAILADVTGDQQNELITAGEWMSPQVFSIDANGLTPVETDLQKYSGWWYSILASDVDGDGDQDLVMGNRGENFSFTGSQEEPAKLWIKDFDNNSTIEKIVTKRLNGKDVTVNLKKELTQQITILKKQNLKYADFAGKSIQELFSKAMLEDATVKIGNWFKTSVALNEGSGKFRMIPLPAEVQFSCVNSIYSADINDDKKPDLILAGNNSGFMPQFSRLDASFGDVLTNNGDGTFAMVSHSKSGFHVRGDVRQLLRLNMGGEAYIVCLVNSDSPKLFKLKK